AGPTAYAIEALALFFLSEECGSSVIQQNDIHFVRPVRFVFLPGATNNTVVYRQALPGSMRCQQGPEEIKIGQRRDDFFNADDSNMYLGERGGEPGITFVFSNGDTARIGNEKITPCNADVRLNVTGAQKLPCFQGQFL